MSAKVRKGIYKNISRDLLYRATTKSPILPCLDVIEWLTRRIDHERGTIINLKKKHVASYQALVLNQMYHFKESQVIVTP